MRKRILRALRRPVVVQGFLILCIAGAITRYGFGCNGWDPRKPFQRQNPEVDRALEMIDAGAYENAEEALRDYLKMDACKPKEQKRDPRGLDVDFTMPLDLREKSDGTFDLGIVLFDLAEKFGKRFGDEEVEDDGPVDPERLDKRELNAKCALVVALAIANDTGIPTELRARAYYIAGNLQFLRRRYADAILAYDQSLRLIPGLADDAGVDGIGRDASWNRAVALRRLENQQEDEPDASEPDAGEDAEEPQQDEPDAPPEPDGGEDGDGSPDAPDGDDDGGGDDAGDAGDSKDAGEDGANGDPGDAGDAGEDAGPDAGQSNGDPEPDAGEPQPSQPDPQGNPQGGNDHEQGTEDDDHALDDYEHAPTYQGEEAKRRPERPRLEDK